MRGRWSVGLGIGVILALQAPAWGMIGMRASELELRYAWEYGPEGSRIYQLDAAYFSPFFVDGRMVGAIAELPASAGPAGVRALLARMTIGLRQVPVVERGTLAANSWKIETPDYHAGVKVQSGKIFVLLQQREPEAAAPEGDGSRTGGAAVSETMPPFYRASNDLEILRMALESYRARHYFRYPRVKSYDELIRVLERSDGLPAGWRMEAPLAEFGVWKTGYHITVEVDGRRLTIRQPERWDPFRVFWQLRPFP